jgi:hypothetical protein
MVDFGLHSLVMWRLLSSKHQSRPRPPMSAETRELLASLRLLGGLAAMLLVLALGLLAGGSSARNAGRCERAGGVYSADAGCVQPHPTTNR